LDEGSQKLDVTKIYLRSKSCRDSWLGWILEDWFSFRSSGSTEEGIIMVWSVRRSERICLTKTNAVAY